MLIHHFNTNQTYELLEENQSYVIKGGALRATHSKNDLHTANLGSDRLDQDE